MGVVLGNVIEPQTPTCVNGSLFTLPTQAFQEITQEGCGRHFNTCNINEHLDSYHHTLSNTGCVPMSKAYGFTQEPILRTTSYGWMLLLNMMVPACLIHPTKIFLHYSSTSQRISVMAEIIGNCWTIAMVTIEDEVR